MLHPACSSIVAKTAAITTAINQRRLRVTPAPMNASPETGIQNAYITLPRWNKLAGVVTRGVVEIASGRFWARPFKFGIGFCVKVQLAPAGRPVQGPSDTELGIDPVGVTVTVYDALLPAVTVAVAGEAWIVKSLTCTCCPNVAWKDVPAMFRMPLFPTVEVETLGGFGAVGVTLTVIELLVESVVVDPLVATVEVFRVPRLQATDVAELTLPQPDPLALPLIPEIVEVAA